MIIKQNFHKIYINLLRLFNRIPFYQPTYMKNIFPIVKDKNLRESETRADLIIENLDNSSGSYLDIGSQLGYFVFKMAETGFFSTGIESSKYPHSYANSLKVINDEDNVCFINMSIDSNNVKNLPTYDVVSILNVFHHLVYFNSFKDADIIMKELVSKTNKILFFETGEFEEKGEYWSDCLSFMGKDSKKWVFNYLKTLGFSNVSKIAEFPTHLNDHKRTLYCCSK